MLVTPKSLSVGLSARPRQTKSRRHRYRLRSQQSLSSDDEKRIVTFSETMNQPQITHAPISIATGSDLALMMRGLCVQVMDQRYNSAQNQAKHQPKQDNQQLFRTDRLIGQFDDAILPIDRHQRRINA